MKIAISCVGLCLIAGFALMAEESQEARACQFSLTTESAKPAIVGPDNIVPLVHVVHQPDSPLEILSIDFQDSYLYLGNDSFMWEPKCKARVRNRSDKVIEDAQVKESLQDAFGGVGSGGSLRTKATQGLQPGEEAEMMACGGKGHGSAKDNTVRILIAVSSVDFPGCRFYPSLHIPHRLGAPVTPLVR